MEKLILSHLRQQPSKAFATIHSHFLQLKISVKQAEIFTCKILHLQTPILPP